LKLCVIPARGGSKRIPKKNIKNFCGKPIISWPIIAAIKSKCFDRIIVSTDDEEIKEVANFYGAETPFTRPKELSDDFSSSLDVVKHAIEIQNDVDKHQDTVCCIYPTAPFISPSDILRGLQALEDNEVDYSLSVTSYPYPIQRALKLNQNNLVEMVSPQFLKSRSQDLESNFHDAAQFYWGLSSAWINSKPIFEGNSYPVYIPRYRVQDIDNEEDWVSAEFMFQAIRSREK